MCICTYVCCDVMIEERRTGLQYTEMYLDPVPGRGGRGAVEFSLVIDRSQYYE